MLGRVTPNGDVTIVNFLGRSPSHDLRLGPASLRTLALGALWVLWMLAFASLAHASDLRHTTIFEEHVDGVVRSRSTLEAELQGILVAAGFAFVDEEQARKIRSVTDTGALLDGQISPVITSLDAERLIVGICRVAPSRSDLFPDRAAVYEADVDIRVIDVDTGRIRLGFHVAERAWGASTERAASEAARLAAREIARRIKTFTDRKPAYQTELTITGIPDVLASERLANAIRPLPPIRSLRVAQSKPGLTKMILTTDGSTAREIALALATCPGIATAVVGHTETSIDAQYSTASAESSGQSPEGRSTAAPGSSIASGPLVTRGFHVEPLFPARLSSYAKSGIGKIELVNAGNQTIDDLTVRATLIGFKHTAIDTAPTRLTPGASAQVSLPLVLDPSVFQRLDSGRTAALQANIRYRVREKRFALDRTTPIDVLPRQTISWHVPESVGAFVTPHSPEVSRLASAVVAALEDAGGRDPLDLHVAVLAAISAQQIRYVADGVLPQPAREGVDSIQTPDDTLHRRQGDCDDLVVLCAALAEAVGVRALVGVTPDHALIALDTGIRAHRAAFVALDPDMLLEHDGTVWIPLETLRIGETFEALWRAGATELKRWHRGKRGLELIEVRRAWRTYPPVNLTAARPANPSIVVLNLGEPVKAAVETNHAFRQRTLDTARSKAESALNQTPGDPATRNRLGMLHLLGNRAGEAQRQFAAGAELGNASCNNNLGNLFLQLGRSADALAAYRRAIDTEPDNWRIHLNAALAACRTGDDEAFGHHVIRSEALGGAEMIGRLSSAGLCDRGGLQRAGRGPTGQVGETLDEMLLWLYTD